MDGRTAPVHTLAAPPQENGKVANDSQSLEALVRQMQWEQAETKNKLEVVAFVLQPDARVRSGCVVSGVRQGVLPRSPRVRAFWLYIFSASHEWPSSLATYLLRAFAPPWWRAGSLWIWLLFLHHSQKGPQTPEAKKNPLSGNALVW